MKIFLEIKIVFCVCFSVAEVPQGPPAIHGIRARYKLGEIIRGNCTSRYSRPAANLTWTINDIQVSITKVSIKFQFFSILIRRKTEKLFILR